MNIQNYLDALVGSQLDLIKDFLKPETDSQNLKSDLVNGISNSNDPEVVRKIIKSYQRDPEFIKTEGHPVKLVSKILTCIQGIKAGRVSPSSLAEIQNDIQSIRDFMEKNPPQPFDQSFKSSTHIKDSNKNTNHTENFTDISYAENEDINKRAHSSWSRRLTFLFAFLSLVSGAICVFRMFKSYQESRQIQTLEEALTVDAESSANVIIDENLAQEPDQEPDTEEELNLHVSGDSQDLPKPGNSGPEQG